MAQLGFTSYEVDVPEVTPTIKEMISALTAAQKVAILDGFTEKVKLSDFKYEKDSSIPKEVVKALYLEIDRVEELSRLLIREEVVLVEATFNEDGSLLTEPEYNEAPVSVADLKFQLTAEFVDSFTAAQLGVVVDRMIAYSKADGSGTPVYYLSEVVK